MRVGIKGGIRKLYRDLVVMSGLGVRSTFSVYDYMYDPQQLRFIIDCIEETDSVKGCCVEAGCERGHTTAFLKKWMTAAGIQKEFFAIDTFSGFVQDQVEYEIIHRGKPDRIRTDFSLNKKPWFDCSMKLAGIFDVVSIEADVAEFDFDTIFPIAFCLLDVDLYLPVKQCLPNIYRNLSRGGIIIVDDCAPDKLYDGAMLAYQEFVAMIGSSQEVRCEKLGIIRKL